MSTADTSLQASGFFVPGSYSFLETVSFGHRTRVYRAVGPALDEAHASAHAHGANASEARATYVLKVPAEEFPSRGRVAALRMEFEFLSRVESPNVVRAHAFLREKESAALVLEDVRGVSLETYVRMASAPSQGGRTGGASLSLRRRLECAVGLARGVAKLHAASLLHKDINPSNVVVSSSGLEPGPGDVRLCGFSVASPWGDARARAGSPLALEGTPAFMAPEQTGRLSLPIDVRTDLACVGATLYFLFTGRRPFEGDDTLALLHAVLTRRPHPPHLVAGADVPAAVSALVMTLLEKDPEARYQSAEALVHDLEWCLETLEARGALPAALPSGKQQFRSRPHFGALSVHRPLADVRVEDFARKVREGLPARLVVVGEPGMGKSALADSLLGALPSVVLSAGHWDVQGQAEPFLGLRRALGQAVLGIHTLDATAAASWKARFLAHLGDNRGLAFALVPELCTLFPGSSPESHPESESYERRAGFVLDAILEAVGWQDRPVVFVLDDVHRADAASQERLAAWLFDPQNQRHAFFLTLQPLETSAFESGTWGDTLFGRLLGGAGGDFESPLLLAPFTETDLVAFVKGALGLAHAEERAERYETHRGVPGDVDAPVRELARYLARRTAGNPLAARECLQALFERGLLRPDAREARWTWDMVAILAVEPELLVPDAVGARLAAHEKGVEEGQGVTAFLAYASLLGAEFDLEEALVLGSLRGLSSAEVARALRVAYERGLVTPSKGTLQLLYLEDTEGDGGLRGGLRLRFSHERVRERLSTSLDEAARQRTHLDLALAFAPLPEKERHHAAGDGVEAQGRDVLSIDACARAVSHAEHVVALLDVASCDHFGRLAARCGFTALERYDYAEAQHLLGLAHTLLTRGKPSESLWTEDHALAWKMAFGAFCATCALRKEDANVVEDRGRALLSLATTSEERVDVLETLASFEIARRDFGQALGTLRHALAQCGESLPNSPSQGAVLWEIVVAKTLLKGFDPERFERLPKLVDVRARKRLQLLMKMTAPAYFASPNLFPVIVMRMLRLTARYGLSPEGHYALAVSGVLECAAFGNIPAGGRLGRTAVALGEREGDGPLTGKLLMVYTTSVRHWEEPVVSCLPNFLRGEAAAIAFGDFEYAALNALGHCAYSYVAGLPLPLVKERCEASAHLARRLGEASQTPLINMFLQIVSDLLSDDGRDPGRLEGMHFREAELGASSQSEKTTLGIVAVFRMQVRMCMGDAEGALAAGRVALRHLDSLVGTAYQPVFAFHFALANLRTPRPNLRAAKAQRAKLRKWATHSPSNYAHKVALVEAEIARVEGRHDAALGFYESAAFGAAESGFLQEEALALELAGRAFIDRKSRRLAARYLREAAATWNRWGARAKVAGLAAEFPSFLTSVQTRKGRDPLSYVSSSEDSSMGFDDVRKEVDFASLSKASRALQESLRTSEALDRVVRIVCENAGADRACLFLRKGMAGSGAAGLRLAAEFAEGHVRVASAELDDVGEKGTQDSSDLPALDVPPSVLNAALNGLRVVVVPDAIHSPTFGADPVVRARGLRSLLCIPLHHAGEISGVLYLENRLLPGAFSPGDVDVVVLLAAQGMLSLQNARLYEDLESRVEARTGELREAIGNLRAAQDELVRVEKLSSLGTLVAGVAHEMNTPLGIGLLVAGRLKDEAHTLRAALEDGLRKSALVAFLDALSESVHILEANLGVLSKLGRQFTSLAVTVNPSAPTVLEVHDWLEGALAGLRLEHEETLRKGPGSEGPRAPRPDDRPPLVALGMSCPAGFRVESDAEALLQVVYNLVRNARAHAFRNGAPGRVGHVHVTVRPAVDKGDGTRNDACWELVVEDDGDGIPPEHVARIFDPFFTTHRPGGHVGLGLHLVHGLVTERLGGRVSVESRVGHGTTFRIVLPKTLPSAH